MAVVGDNLTKMSTCDSLFKPVALSQDIKIRFNLELLKGCEFQCAGCYVNRNNTYTTKDLDIIYRAMNDFRKNGFVFDEIILGPTDFFGAYNTIDLLENAKFQQLFDKKIVLTLLTTLQSSTDEIEKRIKLLNQNIGQNIELEILIPIHVAKILSRDQEYVKNLKKRIELLSLFDCEVEYAMQLNIQSMSHLKDFDLKNISDYIWNEFKTITEFNPSFLRSSNAGINLQTIASWNKMLSESIKPENTQGKEKITFTMANPNHAGFNEITYNFHNSAFYICPFIYENVFDKSEVFKIPTAHKDGFYSTSDFTRHKDFVDASQLKYLCKTYECETCHHAISCVSKQVLFYMQSKDIKKCIIAKDVLDLYLDKV